MPLTFDVSKIKNYEELTTAYRDPLPSEGDVSDKVNEDGKIKIWHPVTEALVFACMFIGQRGIREDNVGTFAARLKLVQDLDGELLRDGEGNPKRVTTEDVIAHIGLECNVSDETDAQWVKRTVTEDYKRSVKTIQRKFEDSRKVKA